MSRACPLLGFVAELELSDGITDAELVSVRQSWASLMEQRGLEHRQVGTRVNWTLSIRSEAAQATDADRKAVEEWASAQPLVVRMQVGPVLDLDIPA